MDIDRERLKKTAQELGVPEELIASLDDKSDDELKRMALMGTMMELLKDIFGDVKVLSQDTLDNGIRLYTTQVGDDYCTAFQDCSGEFELELYKHEEYAEAGHEKWVKNFGYSPHIVPVLVRDGEELTTMRCLVDYGEES